MASKAGLLCNVEVNQDDISFVWKGYNDTLPAFITETTKSMKSLPNAKVNDKKKLFKEAKEFLMKEWKNQLKEKSYR